MQEKPEDIFQGIVAQKAVIVKDGKVLFVRGNGAVLWDLPGGRLHKEEYPEDGLKRELKEELGCDCVLGKVICTSQFYHESVGLNAYFIAYEAQLPNHAKIVTPDDEISEYKWFQRNEVSEEVTFKNCAQAVEKFFKNQT